MEGNSSYVLAGTLVDFMLKKKKKSSNLVLTFALQGGRGWWEVYGDSAVPGYTNIKIRQPGF